MNSFHHLALLSLLLLTSLSSCIRDAILDANERPTVVVECVLSNDDTQELYLNYTKGASKPKAEPLTEAVATLIDLTSNKIVGQFKKKQKDKDLWTLDYTPLDNRRYRLEVKVPGYDLIYAEDTMPKSVDVLERLGGVVFSAEMDSTAWDADPSFNYYNTMEAVLIKRYPERTGKRPFLRGSFYTIRNIENAFMIYGMNYNPHTCQHEIAEEICTDHPSVLPSNITGNHYIPCAFLEDYPKLQLYPGLEGSPLHRRYLIFPKYADNEERYFQISGDFTGDWWKKPNLTSLLYDGTDIPLETDGYLVFASISDVYFSYLKDAIHIQQQQFLSDMTTIYLTNNIYSNITGGVGIFAAIWEKKEQWERRYDNLMAWEKFWKDHEDGWDYQEDYFDFWYGLDELIKLGIIDKHYNRF